jgi:NADH-quinone oxidoreductase subunit J
LIKVIGFIAGACFLVAIVAALKAFKTSQLVVLRDPNLGLVKNLGKILFNEYLLPFEVSSILLLSAMVGAVLLATKEPKTT